MANPIIPWDEEKKKKTRIIPWDEEVEIKDKTPNVFDQPTERIGRPAGHKFEAGTRGAELEALAGEVEPIDLTPITDPLDNYIWKPVKNIGSKIKKEFVGGMEMQAQALEGLSSGRMPLGGGLYLLGMMRQGLSILTGVVEGVVTEPIAENTQELLNFVSGLDEDQEKALYKYAKDNDIILPGDFVGRLFGTFAEMWAPGGWAKSIRASAVKNNLIAPNERLGGPIGWLADEGKIPGIQSAAPKEVDTSLLRPRHGPPRFKPDVDVADDAETLWTYLVEEGATKVDDAGTYINRTADGTVSRMSVKTVGEILKEPGLAARVEAARKAHGKVGGERLYKEVGRELFAALKKGEIGNENLLRVLDDLGMNAPDLFRYSASEAGGVLNELSQFSKWLSKNGKGYSPALRKELNEVAETLSAMHGRGSKETLTYKVLNTIQKGVNLWRGTAVSQIWTAMRNAIGQGIRLGTGMIDDAIQAGINGTSGMQSMRYIANSLRADAVALKDAIPLIRDKKLLDSILKGNPITEGQLMNRSAQEIDVLNRVARWANSANIMQERFFRRLAFQARLDKSLRNRDLPNIDKIDPKKIPGELLEDALQHALDISFASSGGAAAQTITKAFENSFGLLYTVQPFPRFAFANALPFLIEHSPLGLAKALGPKAMSQLAAGNTKAFSRAASRGMIGSTFLGAAMQMRDHPNAGENYWEWYTGPPDPETGERPYVDLRAFGPFTTYLFVAEALKGEDANITAADWVQATAGINRVSGTGLALIDMLRAKDNSTAAKLAANVAGTFGGVFTYPLKQVVDVQSVIEGGTPQKSTRGETIEEMLLNPTIANLPWYNERLPNQQGATTGTARRIVPFIGEDRKKNVIQMEFDRLGIKQYEMNPKGGTKTSQLFRTGAMPNNNRVIIAIMYGNAKLKDIQKIKGMSGLKFAAELYGDKTYSELNDAAKTTVLRSAMAYSRKVAKAEMEALGQVVPEFQQKVVTPSEIKNLPKGDKRMWDAWLKENEFNPRP